MAQSGRKVTATIAGEGPDAQKLAAQAKPLGVGDQLRFIGHCPAREAFAMGRMLVMPSRAESLPYVVLEAAAAGLPIIATDVGGMHEIFGPHSARLIPPDDIGALIGAITAALIPSRGHYRLAQTLQHPGAQRIFAEHDGRVQPRRLSRGDRARQLAQLA